MKITALLITLCLIGHTGFAQETSTSIFEQQPPLPVVPNLKKMTAHDCDAYTTMSPEEIDSLIADIASLEDTLATLEKQIASVNTDNYRFLYASRYVYYIAYDGFTSYEYCVTDSLMGKKDEWDLLKNDLHWERTDMSYGRSLLTITKRTHYLGNNEWWTTIKYYLVREDEYKNLNFIER
jgi:hypothetical protein